MKTIQLFKPTVLLMCIFLFCDAPSSTAQNMLTLPPHISVYSSNVRGYWFVAPINFTITGLKVPTEAGTGTQSIQVFKINGAAVVYPSTGTNFTNLTYIKGAPNGVVQNVNIAISAGDTIGIFGQAGQSISYSGMVTPYTSSISGNTVMLNRIIFQGNIDATSAINYSLESGNIGRVEMYYTCIAPSADNIVAEQVSPCLFNFNLTNSQLVSSYQWDFGDGTPRASGSTTAHAYSASGSYVVKAILKNDCDSTIVLKAITCSTTDIDEYKIDKDAVELYPNPASNVLTIKSENAIMLKEVIIYNLLGQKVYKGNADNRNQYSINIAHLPSGIYSVYIKTDKEVMIRKLEVLK